MHARPLLATALLAALAAGASGCSGRQHAPSGPAPAGMIALPGGSYLAGEPTGPRFDIVTYYSAKPFFLDATEVTVAAYGACVAAGACKPASDTVDWQGIKDEERAQFSQACNRDRPDRADHPVNCVDWAQAKAYCAWAGKRLPSEEEFEWAARNERRGTKFPWGNEAPGARACWSGDGNDAPGGKRDGTCPAGSHPAGDSAAGLKDLSGNVWEWTTGVAVVYADTRGRGGVEVKVARGGGWWDTVPRNVSASVRLLDQPSIRRSDLGFRCAKSP